MNNYKDIPDYRGFYAINNFGNIKNVKTGKILKQGQNTSGYFQITLYKNGKREQCMVHQLMAITFLGHKPNGRSTHVNHINFNKLDNKIKNLEVVSSRENLNKKHLESTSKYTGVCFKKENKKWQSKIVIKDNHFYLGIFKSEMRSKIAYDLALFQENKIKQLLNI